LAIIFKFHTQKPHEAKEKLEKIVKGAFALAKATVIPPNTVFSKIASTVKFEYATDDDGVTLAVHSDHPGIKFFFDFLNVFYKNFQLDKVLGYIHAGLHLKNDLKELLNADSQKRNALNLVKDGVAFTVDLNTNGGTLFKKLLKPHSSHNINPAK